VATTSSTTYASTIDTILKKKLLKVADGLTVFDKFADTDVVGIGAGGTVRVNRVLRPAKKTAASVAGTMITPDDTKALYSEYKDFEMEIYQDAFSFNEDVNIQSFLSKASNRKVIAKQMARSMDYFAAKKVSTGGLRWRIDNDGTYQVQGAADAGSSKVALVDDALDEADAFWEGGYATITSPESNGYDECSKVSAFTASSDTATVDFTNALAAGSKYSLTVGTGLAATDKLTTDGLLRAVALHELLETERFENGILRMFLHAAQHADIWTDTTFKNSAIYDDSGRFEHYRIGRWWDVEFLISSELYREDIDGTENQSTGVVHVSPIFGAHSYTIIRFGMGHGKFGVNFYDVDTPDSQNITLGKTFLGWKCYVASGVLRATSIVNLMTGATDLGITV